ncbi:hypothetical protein AAY473_036169 [Plecturocebus cupreus]
MVNPPKACTLCLEKVQTTQCQPMKVSSREAISSKATEAELPKAMGAHLLYQCDLDAQERVNKAYLVMEGKKTQSQTATPHGIWRSLDIFDFVHSLPPRFADAHTSCDATQRAFR